MSCNSCKGRVSQEEADRVVFTDSLFMRLFLFALSVAIVGITLIPIIIPAILIMLFNRIVMKRNTNVNGALLWVGKRLRTSKKRRDDDEDEDDYEDLDEINPDDYELVDVDVIK